MPSRISRTKAAGYATGPFSWVYVIMLLWQHVLEVTHSHKVHCAYWAYFRIKCILVHTDAYWCILLHTGAYLCILKQIHLLHTQTYFMHIIGPLLIEYVWVCANASLRIRFKIQTWDKLVAYSNFNCFYQWKHTPCKLCSKLDAHRFFYKKHLDK